jgi:hypothetical protein
LLAPPIALATIYDHVHATHACHGASQILVEGDVLRMDYDERVDIGERCRREGFEEQFLMSPADGMGRRGVIERRPLAQVPGPPLADAPRADNSHVVGSAAAVPAPAPRAAVCG